MIKKIKLKNFRNHTQFELEIKQPFLYIYGENGSGKTSVLESIYFCATTKSHRTSDERQLIQKEKPFTQVKIATDQHQYEIDLTKTGKRTFIDGNEKRRLSEFIGHIYVVMFSPNDLELITGAPTERRQFIDLEMLQTDKKYLNELNQYKKILKQRNSLLKKVSLQDEYTFLDILAEQLYEVGIKLIQNRRQFILELNTLLKKHYALFSNNEIDLLYQPNVDEKQFKKHLQEQQKQDILYQTTLAGPHRDDLIINFNGFNAKDYASQGEQRLIAITLKLALLEWLEEKTKQPVVLLLDDVLSELDENKQKIILEQIPKNHQIIMNSAIPIADSQIQKVELKKEIEYVKL